MTLLAGKGGNNSSDSIKITENPDSAVITPIPKKDDVNNQPEKRKKTRSNILRSSSERRKSQNTGKSSQDNVIDVSYSLSSPESEQDKDKKSMNDDDITLIKVVSNDKSDDKSAKVNVSMDDDIKIEIIKSPTISGKLNSTMDLKSETKSNDKVKNVKSVEVKANRADAKELTNGVTPSDPNFDAAKVLDWKDGVGTLPGSTLKVSNIATRLPYFLRNFRCCSGKSL